MPEYAGKSVEELRWEDYQVGQGAAAWVQSVGWGGGGRWKSHMCVGGPYQVGSWLGVDGWLRLGGWVADG